VIPLSRSLRATGGGSGLGVKFHKILGALAPKNCIMAEIASRYSPLVATLGQELFDKVHGSKILLIGAGGIGCEVISLL